MHNWEFVGKRPIPDVAQNERGEGDPSIAVCFDCHFHYLWYDLRRFLQNRVPETYSSSNEHQARTHGEVFENHDHDN